MKKFEYKIVLWTGGHPFSSEKRRSFLEAGWNALGQEGWRFCALDGGNAIFMRELEE